MLDLLLTKSFKLSSLVALLLEVNAVYLPHYFYRNNEVSCHLGLIIKKSKDIIYKKLMLV
jgi:hypothetical protein